jgi:signal transduction histidine kinase
MSVEQASGLDADRALGFALGDLLRAVRGDVCAGDDGDSVAGMLARHALVDPVRGCSICVLDGDEWVRVTGVAGQTGSVRAGTLWPLSGSPICEVLAATAPLLAVDPAASMLGRAVAGSNGSALTLLPLRIGDHGGGEPTSLGAVLLVHDASARLDEEVTSFLDGFASLVSVAVLQAAPAQDWAHRARRLRGNVDAAVALAGSLDAGQIIPGVLERVCEAADASSALLLRVDGGDVVVEGVHQTGVAQAAPGWRGPLDEHPLLVEAMGAADVVLGSGEARARFRGDLGRAAGAAREAMVLPLRVGATVAGFLAVFRSRPRPFIHDDAGSVAPLGNVALLALRNSRLYADAQAASEAMSSFLNLVVHDLRAPLTVLSGYVDLLRVGTFGEAPPAWTKPMELVAAKVQETHRLVDDLLLAARLESGALPTNTEVIDLNDVIRRAAMRSEARAGLAGASIETSPSAAPVTVAADAFHVDRVVDNLINNAINYGGSEPWVRLSVDCSDHPAVRVEDHGVGIKPELQGRIFDRFFRIEHRVPGTGFGLHVGRILAESCGGSLKVERSVPGEGSIFRLELPPATARAYSR